MSYIFCVLLLAIGHLSDGLPQNKPLQHDPTELLELNSGSRIVGGDDAPEGSAPHQVALLFGIPFSIFLCGASIISESCVLTAAHCLASVVGGQGQISPSLHGAAGSNRWHQATTQIRFASHVFHPEWDSRNIKNDLAVLRTVEAIQMKPGKVAVVPLQFEKIVGGEVVFVTGWGRVGITTPLAEQLQMLHPTVLSAEQCEYEMEKIRRVWGPTVPVNTTIETCIFLSCGSGMCHGDSGGAAVSTQTGFQVGVVSWGFPCALGAPDVIASVSGSVDFFKSVLGRHEL